MPFETSTQNAMTVALYNGLGETVTYTGECAGSVSIKALINRPGEFFPGGFEVQTSDDNVTCRIQKADIASPRRDDTLTDADGNWYKVDSYSALNGQEWALEVRVLERG